MSLEQLLKDGKLTEVFQFYKDGELWYRTANGAEYPVPAQHESEARYLIEEQRMNFLR